MRKSTKSTLFALAYLTVLMVAGFMLAGRSKAPRTTVTIAAPAELPGRDVLPLDPGPEPDRPLVGAIAAIRRASPISCRSAEGRVVIPWTWNWDALVAENPTCAAQLLDTLTSRGAPDSHLYHPIPEMVCGAVWKFCPAKWRK